VKSRIDYIKKTGINNTCHWCDRTIKIGVGAVKEVLKRSEPMGYNEYFYHPRCYEKLLEIGQAAASPKMLAEFEGAKN